MKEDFNDTTTYRTLETEVLPNLFTILLEKLHVNSSQISYEEASTQFLNYMDVLWGVNLKTHATVTNPVVSGKTDSLQPQIFISANAMIVVAD